MCGVCDPTRGGGGWQYHTTKGKRGYSNMSIIIIIIIIIIIMTLLLYGIIGFIKMVPSGI